ncbi:hypothetical protein HDV06_005306 [Boothiomyces sp. JEL0866]|nr:hypothetical protein HDV06_005306 [Boothiomyces sp. JEL0866]
MLKEIMSQLSKDILKLCEIYKVIHSEQLENKYAKHSKVDEDKIFNMNQQQTTDINISFHLSIDDLEELEKFGISSALIPKAQEIEETKKGVDGSLTSGDTEKFIFRLYTLIQLTEQKIGYMMNNLDHPSITFPVYIEQILKQNQMQINILNEKYHQACLMLNYHQRVAEELKNHVQSARLAYLNELSALRSELNNKYLSTNSKTFVPNYFVQQLNSISNAERETLEGMVMKEKGKNRNLLKWISNLKQQLQLEKMRENLTETVPQSNVKINGDQLDIVQTKNITIIVGELDKPSNGNSNSSINFKIIDLPGKQTIDGEESLSTNNTENQQTIAKNELLQQIEYLHNAMRNSKVEIEELKAENKKLLQQREKTIEMYENDMKLQLNCTQNAHLQVEELRGVIANLEMQMKFNKSLKTKTSLSSKKETNNERLTIKRKIGENRSKVYEGNSLSGLKAELPGDVPVHKNSPTHSLDIATNKPAQENISGNDIAELQLVISKKNEQILSLKSRILALETQLVEIDKRTSQSSRLTQKVIISNSSMSAKHKAISKQTYLVDTHSITKLQFPSERFRSKSEPIQWNTPNSKSSRCSHIRRMSAVPDSQISNVDWEYFTKYKNILMKQKAILQVETISQFIETMNKQSSKLPIKDLNSKLQDPKLIADGLFSVGKELIATQQKGKQKGKLEIASHLLIIQAIATAYPDMFFCILKGEKTSVASNLFKEFKAELHHEVVGNSLLWICSQQFITLNNGKKLPHPKCIEMWFEYFFTLYKNEKWTSTTATLYARESLKGLVSIAGIFSLPKYQLPLLPVATYTSLMNLTFKSDCQNVDLKKIYYSTKLLMFETEPPLILTNSPSTAFSAFFSPLNQNLNGNLKYELLSNLSWLLGSKSKEVADQSSDYWKSQYENFKTESLLLIVFLLNLRSSETSLFGNSSSLWQRISSSKVHTVLKFIQKSPTPEIKSPLKHLLRYTKPKAKFSIFHVWVQILIFGFFFYALVYVQCDPNSHRTCPLPFEPQSVLKEVYQQVIAYSQPFVTFIQLQLQYIYKHFSSWWDTVYTDEIHVQVLYFYNSLSEYYASNPVVLFLLGLFTEYVKPVLLSLKGKLLEGLTLIGYQITASYNQESFTWNETVVFLGQVQQDITKFVHFQAENMVDIFLPQLNQSIKKLLKGLASVIRYLITSASAHLEVMDAIRKTYFASLAASEYWALVTKHEFYLKAQEFFTLYLQDYSRLLIDFLLNIFRFVLQVGDAILVFMEGDHMPLASMVSSVGHEMAILVERLHHYIK